VVPGRFHKPDLVLLLDVNNPCRQNDFWLGVDLVVEIASPDHVKRDMALKFADDTDIAHGVFRRSDTTTSALLQGFSVRVETGCDTE
jgi:hypothetical protein